MTTTYDTSTNIGKVRLLIHDTDITSAHFTDEEIQVFLDLGGTVYLAAALALESWAGSLSESVDSEKIGDYSYSKKSAEKKLKLATQYRSVDADAPSIGWAELNITDEEEEEEME